ncbi:MULTISPECIES: TonB-dependent receptor plug domain-containing protein [unclassified Janthinobacterium]|uniref:TonB-dependent receptor plug domain-containing protein n=1 Tax=unclassified Janthinobacterium TaxID=2610881 RepID=UPI00034B0751|nr:MULTISPECIES: TonB-dependent receptor [unclassified Janthinobacterium]MEC5163910.1 outer membrane receptor protein involved in Fe transport [Janthinobacterium sp. CG_S6]
MLLLLQLPRAALAQAPAGPLDLTALPFEQLLSLEVYSASKFLQPASEAPSSVSVISAAEIRDFGWRTLADVLRSVRGLYLSYDRNYSYLGARGFLRPGDYNSRFLLQIDGNRINDAVYDQAPVGGEFPLELDLIERIEYAPGPGSSIYGANAFFGVINVITKRPRELGGARASVEAGQFGARKGAASYGWSDQPGGELLLAASSYKSDGRDLYFAEFDQPQHRHGVARGLDYESGQRFFAKGAAGPFSLSMQHAERRKGVPTASFEQAFGDPRSRTVDAQSYLDLGYRRALGADAELSARLFFGRFDSAGDYVYNASADSVNHDGSASRWWGVDLKSVSAPLAGHKLVAGAEYQRNYRLAQYSYDVAPRRDYLNDRRDNQRLGLYLQDELALGQTLLLNAGLRYDRHSRSGAAFSPRLALIWQAGPGTTLKALYGTAYREPNNFELYYAYPGPGGQTANTLQQRERIRSAELALERQLRPNERVTVSVFENKVSGLISQSTDAASALTSYDNGPGAKARGVEVEYQRQWAAATLRSSYSWQRLRQDGAGAGNVNAPAHLAKFNLAAPLGRSPWRAGAEAHYVGPRDTLLARTGGYWLANLNLLSSGLTRHADVAVGVYNLFNRRYADPAPGAHRQDSIAQDGRSARVTVRYAF